MRVDLTFLCAVAALVLVVLVIVGVLAG